MGEPLQQKSLRVVHLLPHQLREPIEVFMFLRPLGLLKVFVLVFRVGLFVCQTRNIKSLLLQILVQVSLNDFVDKFIKPLLAGNVECLGFE